MRSHLNARHAGAAASMTMERNRYADLLRVVAIGGVVYGHWLLVSITYARGQLSGVDAIGYVSWAPWVTWAFQVMPVFFLVGGYVNARSWPSHQARGETWTVWVRDRALRLLWPTAVFVVVGTLAVSVALLAGVPGSEVGEAGWLVALQLWFLPVYLLLAALTPPLLAAHRRWGLWVPVVMAAAAALVSVAVTGAHTHVVGYANYLFVWGSAHQWGFAWQDGTLTRRRWGPFAMMGGGAALLVGLLAWGPFNVDMVGSGNTNPPSIALLAFALAQCGLALACERAGEQLMLRVRLWLSVRRLNTAVMTLYLWHFVPVIVVAIACYPTELLPQPDVGTARWWELRPVWFALLTAALAALAMLIMRAERPLLRMPAAIGPTGPWSPVLLFAGIAAVMFGLTRLAIGGLAPDGDLPVLALAAFAAGLLATFCTGRPSGTGHPASPGDQAHPASGPTMPVTHTS